MLRALVTYLLMLNMFNLSLLKLQEDVRLRDALFSKVVHASKGAEGIFNTNVQLKANKPHSLPDKVLAIFDVLPIENESESESLFENPIHIDSPINELHISALQSVFLHTNAYKHLKVNIHFLDIFSPPPNC